MDIVHEETKKGRKEGEVKRLQKQQSKESLKKWKIQNRDRLDRPEPTLLSFSIAFSLCSVPLNQLHLNYSDSEIEMHKVLQQWCLCPPSSTLSTKHLRAEPHFCGTVIIKLTQINNFMGATVE